MKKIFFTLLTLCISCSVFAQTGSNYGPIRGKFIVSSDKVTFDSKNQIVQCEDTVYIAYGNSDCIKLKADVGNSLKRAKVDQIIQTTGNIFVQIGGNNNKEDFISNKAGYLAKTDGGTYNDAYVIIKKTDLPLKISVNNKDVHIIEFAASDPSHCEKIQNHIRVYEKLPDCDKDTIEISEIKDYKHQELQLQKQSSSAWKITIEYYVGEEKCEPSDGNICFPGQSTSSIKNGDTLIISYKIKYEHDYFGHTRSGNLVEVYIKTSTTLSYWWYLLLVPIIGGIIWFIWFRRKQNVNKNKGNEDLDANADVMEDNEITATDVAPAVKTNDVSTKEDISNGSMPDIRDVATPEKIDLLRCYQELKLPDNSTPADLLDKLKALKQKLDECPETSYGKVISLLSENRNLSPLVAKAERESADVNSKNFEILKKFINIISPRLNEKSAIQKGNLDITEQQMKAGDNRRKMMVWVIEQLEAKGYKELNKNGSVDDNFNKLSQALLSVSNSQINNEAAVINTSISIDDSKKKQLPNSYEEAPENRGNNLELINEVLESSIDDLTPQTLRSAIVKYLNRHLKGLNAENLEDVINELSTALDIKDNKALIVDKLEEKIRMRNNSYVSSGQSNIIKLLDDYNDLVTTNEEQLNAEIREKAEYITQLESKVESKQEEVNTLTQKNTTLMTASEKMLENLRSCAERIIDSRKTILYPCSDSDESQCVDIEDRLFADLLNTTNRIKALHIPNESIPVDTRRSIQQILIKELIAENSPVNTVCRYYAYCRLPFMTDTSREYGITFNRKNMSELFHAVETLYVQFGINLSIPNLFVVGFEEGNFENLTGQTYGDLDNLCQNSRNHFDNIDSKVKPSNVVVDVINVGYTIDGKVERMASVLTY